MQTQDNEADQENEALHYTGFPFDDERDSDYLIDYDVVSRWDWKCGHCGGVLPAGKNHLFWVSRFEGKLKWVRRHDDYMC